MGLIRMSLLLVNWKSYVSVLFILLYLVFKCLFSLICILCALLSLLVLEPEFAPPVIAASGEIRSEYERLIRKVSCVSFVSSCICLSCVAKEQLLMRSHISRRSIVRCRHLITVYGIHMNPSFCQCFWSFSILSIRNGVVMNTGVARLLGKLFAWRLYKYAYRQAYRDCCGASQFTEMYW